MTDRNLSKLPKGKVLMRQMYVPSSETSVLKMTRDESTMGSLFLKRTRRDHNPNAAVREREREADCELRTELKDRVKKDVAQKIKSSEFKTNLRAAFVTIPLTHMLAPSHFIFILRVKLTALFSISHTHHMCKLKRRPPWHLGRGLAAFKSSCDITVTPPVSLSVGVHLAPFKSCEKLS